MAFFYLLLFLLLLFGVVGAVVYFFSDLTSRTKYTILAALILGWLLIASYSYYQNKKRIRHDRLYYLFIHGKSLHCTAPFGQKVEVNKTNFNFVSGTMVFLGKEKSPYAELVIPMDRCEE